MQLAGVMPELDAIHDLTNRRNMYNPICRMGIGKRYAYACFKCAAGVPYDASVYLGSKGVQHLLKTHSIGCIANQWA